MRPDETQTGDETMFTVTYANHDNGCSNGQMVRETLAMAQRTADLMRQCGYDTVTITAN